MWAQKDGAGNQQICITGQGSFQHIDAEFGKRRAKLREMAEEFRNYGNFESVPSSSTAIDSSNIGFKLLKKHGWKEGTGLGAYEQGRLEPVETHVKKNKCGVGAEKFKKAAVQDPDRPRSREKKKKDQAPLTKKEKALSKRMKRMAEREQQFQEKEFERAFFREFWPDNV